MAQTVKYIGRTTDFRGKTLWEIVGNLKDYGVGRIIIRNMFQRYEEPCYMKILKVEAQPQPIEVRIHTANVQVPMYNTHIKTIIYISYIFSH